MSAVFLLLFLEFFFATYTNSLKILSCIHLCGLCVSATEHTDKIWAMVPFSIQLHLGFSIYPHCCRLAGDGRALYTDGQRSAIQYWSFFHISNHEMLRCGGSHRIQASCLPSSAARDFLTDFWLSTCCLNSPRSTIPFLRHCTSACCWKCDILISSLPVYVLPIMFF